MYFFIMVLGVLMLVGLVYFLFFLIFYSESGGMEMISCYECGFEPYSLTRQTFSYRFYLISILFVIFDVEIALILPVPFLIDFEVGLWVFMIFIMVLIVGLVYEYYCGSLEWLGV
uniref:NADH dehydrogenase subunit 3 n=1 Tax=Plator insolens TaxID=2880587 RepID=UPI001F137BDE|nr:NADH dehydrogenase subunit 3 [Plator insolens]UMI39149.1 NADH dehydrogenase subunit 3 [Plator insolens]